MRTRSLVAGLTVLALLAFAGLVAVGVEVRAQSENGGPVPQVLVCPDDRFEDNDTQGTATESILPFYEAGLRSCPGDFDWFSFFLAQGSEVQIDAFFTNAEGNIDIVLHDPDGNADAFGISSDDNEKVTHTADQTGTWAVGVNLFEDLGTAEGNSYALQVSTPGSCPEDSLEDNDTQGTATLGASPLYLAGLRACPGDQDWFSVLLLGGADVQVDAFFTHAEGNISISLFDAAGTFLNASTSPDDNEKFTHPITADGFYFVLAFLEAGQDLGTAEGNTYALQVSQPGALEPCPDDALEENDLVETATEVSLPFYRAGLRSCPADGDFFSFFASVGDELQIDALFTAAEGEIAMVLFDPNSDAVVADPSTPLDNKTITHTAAKTGVYVLFVVINTDAGTAVGNTYTLQITGPKPTATPTATLALTATPTATATPTVTLAVTATPTATPPPVAPTATATSPVAPPTATATTAAPTATPTLEKALGDVNDDGSVNSIDAALILQQDAGLLAEVPNPASADLNGDEAINSIDAALVLQCTAGLLDCASLAGAAGGGSRA